MSAFGDTIDALARYQQQWQSMHGGASGGPETSSNLREIEAFGPNPGELRCLLHTPAKLPRGAALVVALHGCTQSAAAFERGTGWSTLADRGGFAVLYPEQRRANNVQLCFNWFQPQDTARGRGEAASIHGMIERVIGDLAIDRKRIFVTGLSAGGAMAVNLLAAYPETFAAGSIFAGLPQGAANDIREAFGSMMQGDKRPAVALIDSARSASSERGPFPRIAIWQGSADTTVNPANADALVRQWRGLHELAERPTATTKVGSARREVWLNDHREPLVERWTLPQLGHAVAIEAARCGEAGAFFSETGLPSIWLNAKAWGLATDEIHDQTRRAAPALPALGGLITKALRAAGLA